MVGFYPDAPGNRIAYHKNGTAVVLINSIGGTSTVSVGEIAQANNEDNSNYADFWPAGDDAKCAIIFPEPYDLTHYFIWATNINAVGPIEISEDTTNGVDGTWTQIAATWVNGSSLTPAYRTAQVALTGALDVKGIRFLADANFFNPAAARGFHLYGEPSPSASPNRLELWHPTLDQSLFYTPSFLDWGDIARDTTPAPSKQFRIKNQSGTFVANGIVVTSEVSLDGGGATPFSDAHSFSLDGITFTPTVTITSLAVGAISGLITVEYAPTLTDPLSVNSGYIKTTTTSWS